jgi:hypothetical protein
MSLKMDEINSQLPPVRRARTHPEELRKLNIQHFAGRIGGNQLFTTTDEDVTASIPDATRTATWHELLDLRGFIEWSTVSRTLYRINPRN